MYFVYTKQTQRWIKKLYSFVIWGEGTRIWFYWCIVTRETRFNVVSATHEILETYAEKVSETENVITADLIVPGHVLSSGHRGLSRSDDDGENRPRDDVDDLFNSSFPHHQTQQSVAVGNLIIIEIDAEDDAVNVEDGTHQRDNKHDIPDTAVVEKEGEVRQPTL